MSLLSSYWLSRLRQYPRLGVAISGGSDSVALACLCAEANLPITLLHVNYGLRGAESDSDESHVRQLASTLGCPVLVERLDPSDSSEETLRDLRYQWFSTCPVDAILTGHTLEDQAETVLFRLLRGSGPPGLAAILPDSPGPILRPLLHVSRNRLRDWLQSRQISWREDSSNQQTHYRRNWLRHHLLPQIREQFNPEVDAALARLANIVAEDEAWLRSLALPPLAGLTRPEAGGSVLHCAGLTQLPLALQRRVLRAWLEQTRGGLRGLDFQHFESLLALCHDPAATGRLQLPGLDALRSFDWLLLMTSAQLASRPERNFRFPLPIPSRICLPEDAGIFEATLAPACQYNEEGNLLDWDRLQASLGPESALELRNWRPGDRLLLANSPEPKKLKEMFQIHRIPLWRRRSWPIVVLGNSPVWAGEFGPAVAFAAGADTRTALRLSWVPAPIS